MNPSVLLEFRRTKTFKKKISKSSDPVQAINEEEKILKKFSYFRSSLRRKYSN